MAKEKLVTDLRLLPMDRWQKRVIKHKGNIALRCGRQTGKSTVVARKARDLAIEYPGTTTLVVAASQRQSSLLFEKIRGMFDQDNADAVKFVSRKTGENLTDFKKRRQKASIYHSEPTQTRIELKNNSQIFCHPTGRTGAFIRGFTVDFLIADEAAFIPDEVWVAIVPMMATSKKLRKTGWMILLGTPAGKHGYFYDAFQDKNYLHIHVTSEECKRIHKDFLRKQRYKLTKIQYAQEYLGEFVEEYDQFFPTKELEKCGTLLWEFNKDYDPLNKKYYLGVDFARYGGDQNAFYVVEMDRHNFLKGVWSKTTERVGATESIGRIQELDKKWKFIRIFVDSGGLGGAIYDVLREKMGKKVVGLDNSMRSIEINDDPSEKKRSILKEDLYSNALILMESNKIRFKKEGNVINSLKSITFEYSSTGRLLLKGKGNHLCEAFVRACWCVKNKGLRLFLA